MEIEMEIDINEVDLKQVKPLIRAAGMNLEGYARVNNFRPQTLRKVLCGRSGIRGIGKTQKMLQALYEDGFLVYKETKND